MKKKKKMMHMRFGHIEGYFKIREINIYYIRLIQKHNLSFFLFAAI